MTINQQLQNLTQLDDDWKLQGACRGKDVNEFYEFGHMQHNAERQQEMVEFCEHACKVRARCLLWALYIPEEYGVWGGKTEDERRELRKDKRVKDFIKQIKLDNFA